MVDDDCSNFWSYMVIAALGIMPIVKSAMLGVVLLLALGIITPQESYQSINWQVIVLISFCFDTCRHSHTKDRYS